MPDIPLIAQQVGLSPVGEIRLGKKVPIQGSNGKTRPAKIDKFRLTSTDKVRLDAAAELYGGTVQTWEGQWEVFTETDIMPIAIIPHQALSVSYELWGQKTIDGKKTPVICLRSCDGEFEKKSERPCLCANEEEMQCKPTARLSVMLLQVPGLGVWKLVTHGFNALRELQGTIQLLEALVATGRPVQARLRLDKRESANEQGVRKFVVPTIDIDHTLGQVLNAIGVASGSAIDVGTAGALPAGPTFQSVPAEIGPAPSIADQVAQAAQPKDRPPRSNAAEPIRATGVQPRTVAELAGAEGAADAPPGPDGDGEPAVESGSPSPTKSSGGEEAVGRAADVASTPDETDDDQANARSRATQVVLWIKELDDSDDYRHEFLRDFSDGRYSSAKDVPVADLAALRAAIVRRKRAGAPAATADAEQSPDEVWDATRWRAECAKVRGTGPARLIRYARDLAATLGIAVPASLDEMSAPELVGPVLAWLHEQAAA